MKSIKTKLITLTISFAVGISLVLVITSIIAMGVITKNNFDAFATPLANQASMTISTYMSENINGIIKITRNTSITNSLNTESKIDFLNTQLSAIDCNDFAYYDVNGKTIYLKSNVQKDYTTQDEFSEVLEKHTSVVTDPYTNANGKVIYSIYTPIFNSSNEFSEILVTSFDYKKLNDIVNDISFSENGRAYLINSDGCVTTNENIIDATKLTNPKDNPDSKELVSLYADVINEKEGYEFYKNDGKKCIAAYSYIPELDNYIIFTAPYTDFADTAFLVLIFIGLAIILIAASFLFSYRMSKKIALPIISTSERLKSLAEGNLTDPVNIAQTKDELYVMTTALQETIVSFKMYITKITDALVDIAEGDLTDRVHGSFHGDFIKIKSTFNSILASLIDTFSNINMAAEQVNSGASQVSNGAQALSQGATEQASAIQELSATIADVSHQITQNAKSAKKAEGIVDDTTQRIVSCNGDMTNMLGAMDTINSSSNEISKIIKVIDDIAFQTNILALNAAVEAARAGSAGKGFAVVADEVRSLAAKSAEAAKQTTALIEESVENVNRGSKIAKQTANALAGIVEKSEDLNVIVKNISKASEQQSESIEQINTGVEQISAVVQTNTATAEQSAAASEELSGQSLLLSNMISKFRLGDKEKIFGENSKFLNTSSNSSSEFSFSSPANEPTLQFNFSGSVDNEPASEFSFLGTVDNEPASQFNFSGSVDNEPASQFNFSGSVDNEPTSQFNFSGTVDNEPASEFSFSGTIDEEPASQFDFTGSIGDDLKIDLDDEDSKY